MGVRWYEEVIPERCIPTKRDMEAVITTLCKAKRNYALGLEFLIELNEYGPELTP